MIGCRLLHNGNAVSHYFTTLGDLFKLIMKRRLSNDYFDFVNLIVIQYWFRNDLLQKSFQANIVFNDQLRVSSVELRECFRKFMISATYM